MKLTINTSKIIFGLVIFLGILVFPNLTKAINYTWTGDEIDQPALPTCDVKPRSEGGYTVTCGHEDGIVIYKININGTTSSCDGKSVSYVTNYLDNLPISYGPSNCPLTLSLKNPIGEGTVRVTGTGFVVPSGTSEPKCAGGTRTRLVCSPSEGWETTTCPYDASLGYDAPYFICPFESNLQAVFSRELDPWVVVEGVDTRDNRVYTGQMTVPYPTSEEQENVLIRWTSNDVESCSCEYKGEKGDCGVGISLTPGVPVLAGTDGYFSLTSDKKFTVTCEEKTN